VNLYFVRHGESEANTRHVISNRESSFHLTAKGMEQAEALAEKIRNISFQAVFCSPVLRARETADVLSAALRVPYQVTEALREYDCGILEEKSDQESWGTHRRYFEDWLLLGEYASKPEGGECFLDIRDRFVPFVEGLMRADSHEGQNILLVGHGGLFLLMLPLVLTNIDHSFATSLGMGNAEYVLARQESNGLVCLQWGEQIFKRSQGFIS
jgi:broad specificity phosphatase PhoE